MLNHRSLTVQFAAVFLLALSLVGAAFYLILDRIYVNQLKSQAETVADNVDAFGSWVAQYGRVWVKDDNKSYLGHASLLQADEATAGTASPQFTPVDFYSKNPALAHREYSEVVERSPSPSKFRLTSHNVMNPGNKPDAFEEGALRRVRENNLKEYYELTPGGFCYARTVYHKASCIACHGDADKAPTTSRSAMGRPTASASRRGTSPASSASACRRDRSGMSRSTSSAFGTS